jgi:hypothetical protein
MDKSKFNVQLPRDKSEGSELRLFMINLSKTERLKTQKWTVFSFHAVAQIYIVASLQSLLSPASGIRRVLAPLQNILRQLLMKIRNAKGGL